MSLIDINPADAVVFAPNLPRTYDGTRPAWTAPAKLTVSLLLHAPYYLDVVEEGMYRPSSMPGGVGGTSADAAGNPPHGQVTRLSQYDFGLTNGIHRLVRTATALGLPYAVALDAYGCERVPRLAETLAAGAEEVVVRGLAATAILSPTMSEQEESDYIAQSKSVVERTTGRSTTGWFGPERGASPRTPGLLRQAGFEWMGDWPIDEIPVPLAGDAAGLTVLPFSLDTEDGYQLYSRGMRFGDYERMLHDMVDRLLADADVTGPRFLGLSWAGWVLGQACYADIADRLLARLAADPDIRVVAPGAVLADTAGVSA